MRLGEDFQYGGIYLDSATRGIMPSRTINAAYQNIPTIRTSIHRQSREASELLEQDMALISSFLDVNREKLAVLPSQDYAWNVVLRSYCEHYHPKKIHVSVYDHHSILGPVVGLQKHYGYDIKWLGHRQLPRNVGSDDLLVINHASFILGEVRDLESHARTMHESGGKIAVDLSNTAGQFRIELSGFDYAVIDGSMDLLGPQSATLLYLGVPLRSAFFGSTVIAELSEMNVKPIESNEQFEIGQPDLRAIHGLALSMDYLENNEARFKHRERLHSCFFDQLQEGLNFELVNPERNLSKSQFLCLSPKTAHAHDWALLLDEISNIAVRSGGLCSYLGLKTLGLSEVLLVSPHIYNTEDDLTALIQALASFDF